MTVFCLKFSSYYAAKEALYIDGEPKYPNVSDNNGNGLYTEWHTNEDGSSTLLPPSSGGYHADMSADALPDELMAYVIEPKPIHRKHKFLGE